MIIGREACVAGPSFPDDIHLLSAVDLGRIDPRFKRDGVAGRKIEQAAGAGIVVAERRGRVEKGRPVLLVEQRELTRRRSRTTELHVARRLNWAPRRAT